MRVEALTVSPSITREPYRRFPVAVLVALAWAGRNRARVKDKGRSFSFRLVNRIGCHVKMWTPRLKRLPQYHGIHRVSK